MKQNDQCLARILNIMPCCQILTYLVKLRVLWPLVSNVSEYGNSDLLPHTSVKMSKNPINSNILESLHRNNCYYYW